MKSLKEKTVISLYQDSNMTGTTVASIMNISIWKVYKILKDNGIEKKYNKKGKQSWNRKSVNHNVFKEINQYSAYWIGFLMADGSILYPKDRPTPELSLQLSLKDKNHVKKFKDFLNAENKIVKSKNRASCKITIASQEIVETLKKYGIKPNKTFTAKVNKLENNQHFWRGVVDGDGSIHIGQDKYPRLDLYGSEKLLSQFAEYIRKIYPNWKGDYHQHKSIYKIGLTGTVTDKIVKKLYKNYKPVLDRKEKTASKIIQLN